MFGRAPSFFYILFLFFFLADVHPAAGGETDTVKNLKAMSLAAAPPAEPAVEGCEFGSNPLFGKRMRVFNLGEKINTRYAEYNQVLNAGEDYMIFTARRDSTTGEDVYGVDGQYFEDIMIAEKVDGKFRQATRLENAQQLFPYDINTTKHEAPVFLGWEEERLVIFKGDKLWYSDRIEEGFSAPVLYGPHVNPGKYQRHASFTEDGNTIYFSSEVFDKATKRFHYDIFVTRLGEDGKWSKPVALPAPLNTAYNEDSPEVSRDGQTMHFSSDRPGGYGGYDVYRTAWDGSGWSAPVNLCKPINSPAHDIFFKPSQEGTTAYFSSNRLGGFGNMDIYKVVLDIPRFTDCVPYEPPGTGSGRHLVMRSADTVLTGQPFVIDGAQSKLDGRPPNNWYWKLGERTVKNTSVLQGLIDSSQVFEVRMAVSAIDTERIEIEYACVTRTLVAVRPEDYQGRMVSKGVELSALLSDNEILVKLDNQLTNNPLSLSNDIENTLKNTPVEVRVLDNDTHPRHLDLKLVETTYPQSGTARILDRQKGVLEYRPANDFTGLDHFRYTAVDGEGTESEAFVVVKVKDESQYLADQEVNNDYRRIPGDSAVNINVLENDRSPAGSPRGIASVSQPAHGEVEIRDPNAGNISYKPKPGYKGTDAFTYSTIGKGGQVNSALVKITMTENGGLMHEGVNSQNDLRQTVQGKGVSLNVFANDDLASWSSARLIAVSKPANGNVRIQDAKAGQLLYVPNRDFIGTESFTYTVSNDQEAKLVEGVTIIVTPDERLYAMELQADLAATQREVPVVVPVLANDRHKQGLGMKVWNTTQPANGKVAITNAQQGLVAYTPAEGFSGRDVFEYTAVDELGIKSRSSVTIDVTGKEEVLITLQEDAAETASGTPVSLNLLDNDRHSEGRPLQLAEVYPPERGKVVVRDPLAGAILYTPEVGYSGTEQFIYKVKDDLGNVATALVTVHVKTPLSLARVDTTGLPALPLKPIYFDFDKASVRHEAQKTMADNISVLKQYPEVIIKVVSHCDARGSSDYNIALSNRRAINTVEYLVTYGIPRERIIAVVGMGEAELVNDCGDGHACPPEAHERNRRSEFIIAGRVKE